MAIAFDAAISGNTGTPLASTLTVNLTVGSISDGIIVIGANIHSNGSNVSVGTLLVDGATATFVAAANDASGSRSELWYFLAPAAGSRAIAVTLAAAATRRFVVGAVSYSGVDQVTPVGTAVTATGNSTSGSVVVTSATGELVVDTFAKRDTNEVLTVNGAQTQRYIDQTTNGTTSSNVIGAGSEQAGAASVTMSWSWLTNSRRWAQVGVPLKPAGAATAGLKRNSSLNGLGSSGPFFHDPLARSWRDSVAA